ncbi:ATP-binding protein [Aggregatilineales bacterium SYSU G02658]
MATPSPSPRDVGGLVRRIQQFGSATEQLFSRLYGTLSLRHAQEKRGQARHELEKRNRRLRRLLRQRGMRLERLEAILNNISEGIILQDLNGSVIETNAAAREIIGTDRNLWNSEIVRLFTNFSHVQQLSSELTPLDQPRRLMVANRLVNAQVVAIADSHGQRVGTLIILRPDTADDSIHKVKASLVEHISHELRTPLTPLRLASEMLTAAPADAPPNRRMLELLSRNVDILERMVNEMIDIAAMSSGILTMQTQAVLLEDMVMDLYDEYKEDIAEAHHEIQILFKDADRLIVQADPKYLRWALSNVLKNSIQYTEPNGRIYVRVGVLNSDPPHVFIEVEDTGVGISPDDQPHVFDLFFRGKPRGKNGKLIDPRGLGQGLYVARSVAEAHGGSLRLRSEVGKGSQFRFLLPLYQQPALMAD